MINSFDIKILEDGTIQLDSEEFDEQKHLEAEEFMNDITELLGGEKKTTEKEHPFWKNRIVKRAGKIQKIGG